MTKTKFKGIAAIISAVACYGLFGVLAKFMGPSFGSFTQNWIRNSLILIIILFYAYLTKRSWKKIKRRDLGWMTAWTLSGSSNTILLYISFSNIPIGTVYFLLYAFMIGTGFISGKLLFNEKITTMKVLALTISVLGLLMIYFLDIRTAKFIYTAFALSAGVLVGLWNTLSNQSPLLKWRQAYWFGMAKRIDNTDESVISKSLGISFICLS